MSEEVKRYTVFIHQLNGKATTTPDMRSQPTEMVLAADHDRIVSALTEAGVEMQAERDKWQQEAIRIAVAVCALGKMEFDQMTDDSKLIEVMSVIREAIQERDTLRAEVEQTENRLHEVAVACATAEQERDKLAERCRELEDRNERIRDHSKFVAEGTNKIGAALRAVKEALGLPVDASVLEDLTPAIDTLRAEVERLTDCLQKANEQAEHFEREWYLRGDEVERLRKDAELERVIQRAASELPDGWEIRVSVERDAGVVELIDPHGTVVDFPSNCTRLCEEVSDAIDAALEASR